MEQKTKITQTPLEQLKAEKLRLKADECYRQQRLAEHFQYMQDNAGGMLMAGLTSLISPGSKTKRPKEAPAPGAAAAASDSASSFDLADIMSLAGGMGPLLWSVAQPFVLTWGIKRIKKLFSSLLFKKKK